MRLDEFEEMLDYCLRNDELIIRMAHRITALENQVKELKGKIENEETES